MLHLPAMPQPPDDELAGCQQYTKGCQVFGVQVWQAMVLQVL